MSNKKSSHYKVNALYLLRTMSLLIVLLVFGSTTLKAQIETGENLVDSASEFAQIQYFHTLIVETGLNDKLSQDGPFTVFAPTDEAFRDLPDEVMEGLLENPDELREILRAHIMTGTTTSEELSGLENMPSVQGTVFEIDHHEQGISIGDAMMVAADVIAINGAIHAIDKVLIPR